MAEIGCYACRRCYAAVHWYCYRFISYLGSWFSSGENLFFFFFGIPLHILAFYRIFCFLTLSWFIDSCLTRRAKVEEVMQWIQMLKDQWDQFSALLSMRRNLEMSCKVLRTPWYRSLVLLFKALISSPRRWFHVPLSDSLFICKQTCRVCACMSSLGFDLAQLEAAYILNLTIPSAAVCMPMLNPEEDNS